MEGRWRRFSDLLHAASEGEDVGLSMASLVAEFLDADHASLVLVSAGEPRSIAASGVAAEDLCRLQFTLGEGPALEALSAGVPVLIDDVAAPEFAATAPAFSAVVRQRGIGAVFAFPLRIGEAVVGVMTAHRASPGPLSDQQHADALVVETLATTGLQQIDANRSGGQLEVRVDPMGSRRPSPEVTD
jgi:GAF domain-containing protein